MHIEYSYFREFDSYKFNPDSHVLYSDILGYHYYLYPHTVENNKFDNKEKYCCAKFLVYPIKSKIKKILDNRNKEIVKKSNLRYIYSFFPYEVCDEIIKKYEDFIGNDLNSDFSKEEQFEKKKKIFYDTLYKLAPSLNFIIKEATFFEKIDSEGLPGFILVETAKPNEELMMYRYYSVFVYPAHSKYSYDNLFEYALIISASDNHSLNYEYGFRYRALKAFSDSAKYEPIEDKIKAMGEFYSNLKICFVFLIIACILYYDKILHFLINLFHFFKL